MPVPPGFRSLSRPGLIVFSLQALLAFVAPARAQGLPYVQANYEKFEFQIPMRDGVRLFTSVYVPKDRSVTHPILLNRTPYSVAPYGPNQYRSTLGATPHFTKSGYIVAYQDVRGRWMSEGEFVNMRPQLAVKDDPTDIDESTDTYDTIAWLLDHLDNDNGRVGVWGISYPGFYTSTALIDAHPAIVAASPQAPIADWFVGDDFHHNGALFLPHLFNFMANFGRPRPGPTIQSPPRFDHGTPDGYQFFQDLGPLPNADKLYFKGDVAFWNQVMEHGTYDEFWKSRNLRPHLKNIRPAVMTVGGWFDAENLFGALETYRAIEASSPNTSNILVMGPWVHGGWNRTEGDALGPISFGAETSDYYRDEIEFPFFEHHLKGKGSFDDVEARVFVTGSNQWRDHDEWPPAGARETSIYLAANSGLSFEPPGESGPQAFDDYVSDPAHPVPFIDEIDIGMAREYMVEDQRFAARRPDVLVYQTGPLESDLTLAGPIEAALNVATTGTDADWVVKVIDVYPASFPDPSPNPAGIRMGNYQQLVRGDVMRGKFRQGFDKPQPFTPGEPALVAFKLPDIYHTFRKGHRLMVQVQSTWFPLVDRNPQTFTDIYSAKPEDFQEATHRVYRSRELPSSLKVRVIETQPAS